MIKRRDVFPQLSHNTARIDLTVVVKKPVMFVRDSDWMIELEECQRE
jgi:hypothetical protein